MKDDRIKRFAGKIDRVLVDASCLAQCCGAT
jgi:16S rRNA C967 or C1407 C5-methylase (RsmB/RsmF family)